MITLGYTVRERFGPPSGDAWTKYHSWSGLGHLVEVVGLDALLCPNLLPKYEDEDWNHLVFADHEFGIFDDLAYALHRLGGGYDVRRHQLLAVSREPTASEVRGARAEGFRFLGCDLIEKATSISALTNCGGFDGAYEASDVSNCGLVAETSRAYEIRGALRRLYPNENHAHCAVWAIWRREGE